MVLRKKEIYTIVTPIPSFIPRQLAIDILHSHGEVITLNPLVLGHKQIKAPRDAASDEYFSTWYEITERVQFVPGMGRFGSGKISFNACFHDLPWGLQTHVYAPLNIDMRNKYRIGGNQPGVEPPEQPEIGLAELGVPRDGLYLREDIEIRCNIAMVATVKAQMKASSKEMVQRIIKKAELLDAGILQAMIEDGRMKTFNPQNRVYTGGLEDQSRSPQRSPLNLYEGSPTSPTRPYQVPRPVSSIYGPGSRPGTSGSLGPYPPQWQQMQQHMGDESRAAHTHVELPNNPQNVPGSQSFPMELPGDFLHADPSSQPPPTSPSDPTGQRWSHQPNNSAKDTRPMSFASDPGITNRISPAPDKYAVELATHRETPEEYGSDKSSWGRVNKYRPYSYNYNPADFARPSR
ncbi:hypothetical protein F4808DRAFT_315936 [Astrocystis sublimbata]|nr:hypothetical protein F4808DRAFT_315936 [Astrocystis sublimbata]